MLAAGDYKQDTVSCNYICFLHVICEESDKNKFVGREITLGEICQNVPPNVFWLNQ